MGHTQAAGLRVLNQRMLLVSPLYLDPQPRRTRSPAPTGGPRHLAHSTPWPRTELQQSQAPEPHGEWSSPTAQH